MILPTRGSRTGAAAGQRGISFVGVVILGAVLVFGFTVGAKVAPTVMEYQAIRKAANKAAEGSTVAEVRAIFDRAAAIDDITSIKGADLDVTKDGDKVVVAFAYNREIELFSPAYLLLKYAGKSK